MSEGKKILIVEDERHIANLLRKNLRLDGYEPILADSAISALEQVQSRKIDLILLDIMLPDGNGIDLCRNIKHKRPDVPIIILSALGQSSDRIKGLKSGADDYLPKPFDLEELSLRMEKLLNRFTNSQPSGSVLTLGEAKIDFENYSLSREDKSVHLTSKEVQLLKYLIEKKGQVLSREQILEHVWGYEQIPNTRTIDNFILSFRKYIEKDPNNPKIILTVRGIGYKLDKSS